MAKAKLAEYKRKRDPKKTPEPFGSAKRRPGAGLRRPAPRRASPPLRLSTRAKRRARELGRPERRAARAGAAAPRRPRRGPPPRVRDIRGRDPEGAVRGRHGRDLGPGHVRARRGEEGRRPHGPAARRTAQGHLRARSGQALGRPEELADPAQEGRHGAGCADDAPVPADARDAGRGGAARRLALRDQVGRLSDRGHGLGRRSRAAHAQGPGLHEALRKRREGARQGAEDSGLRRRRRGLRARRGGAPELLGDAAGQARDADRLLRVRPARGRGRAARRAPTRGAAQTAREAPRQAEQDGPLLGDLRRRRGAARGGEPAEPRRDHGQAPGLEVPARAGAHASG